MSSTTVKQATKPDSAAVNELFQATGHGILARANRGEFILDFLRGVATRWRQLLKAERAEVTIHESRKAFQVVSSDDGNPRNDVSSRLLESDDLKHFLHVFTETDAGQLVAAMLTGCVSPRTPNFCNPDCYYNGDVGHTCNWPLDPAYPSRLICVLRTSDRIFGVLQLHFRRKQALSEVETTALCGLTTTTALATAHNLAQNMNRERVKELTCLYGISRLASQTDCDLDEVLPRIVALLPPAYLYPSIAEARIVCDGVSYATPGFSNSPYHQQAPIVVRGAPRGEVRVDYRERRPQLDEGPFLREERNLIDGVSQEIGLILERRQSREETEALQEQLRHADRLATIGQLAAGVAHELNEPLTNMLGYAQLLTKTPNLDEQALSDLRKIERNSLHAREIIRKLLLFARQIPPKQDWVQLNGVVAEVADFFEQRLRRAGIVVKQHLFDTLSDIQADESLIRQIVINLVVNSIQAMPAGGELTLSTEGDENEVRLTVRDTGVGIPADIQDKIFLPFFTTKDIDQGTGLGLAVTHGIITSHEGKIEVDSQPGHGATFIVCLPVRRNGHTKDNT
jgi:signal transduction histidine kinase